MSRYFTRPRAANALWVDDDVHVRASDHMPTVCDHEATETGILDINGDPIMRAPRAIGFGRRDEW